MKSSASHTSKSTDENQSCLSLIHSSSCIISTGVKTVIEWFGTRRGNILKYTCRAYVTYGLLKKVLSTVFSLLGLRVHELSAQTNFPYLNINIDINMTANEMASVTTLKRKILLKDVQCAREGPTAISATIDNLKLDIHRNYR
jgi:hypothetical protein